MDQSVPSTAGRRQFNDTAMAKLMAEGVPRNVAAAFVNHGIDKSGRYTQLRDHVCKMEYVRYLLPRTVQDYKDPMRVGQMSPYVEEIKVPRFFTEFAMSDVEASRLGSAFPEFNVIPRGTTYNQHGYYANKRYAETELLVGMVFDHARKHGGDWDPRSLVDVGGNEVWHAKRDRPYVHNDNPVLSARDVARYTTRQVFSGASNTTTCDKKFSQCDHKAMYGIGVHSTYDFSPRALAFGMHKRGMKVFFLVVNVVPGLASMAAGQHEVDGMVVTLHRPNRASPHVAYTFKHDASLEYKHPLRVHQEYMHAKATFDITRPDGTVATYVYRICSLRGNSLIASVMLLEEPIYDLDRFVWTPLTRRVYYITMKLFDVTDLEVDCEFFDRLVLQGCGARGAENYDIVSLYKYAKSLRQRVSINGIVLSSGYTMNPDQLVVAVVAAYTVAAAFRVESASYFKEATNQIHVKRGQGFLRDVLRVVGKALLAPFGALAAVLGTATFYTKADRKLKQIIARHGAVQVMVDKPHAGTGAVFQPDMLEKPPVVRGDGMVRMGGLASTSWVTPLAPGGWRAKLVPTFVKCSGVDKVFLSYSVPRLDERDCPLDGKPQYYDLTTISTEHTVKSEEYRSQMYAATLRKIVGVGAFDIVPLVLPNGDRLYRKRMRPVDGELVLSKSSRMVTEADTYVVFRGVGDRAVALPHPACYDRGMCLRFVLFYVDEVANTLRVMRLGRQVGVGSEDVATAVRDLAADGRAAAVSNVVVAPLELPVGGSPGTSEWEKVSTSSAKTARATKVVKFADHGNDPAFVARELDKGMYYMTGAVPVGTPAHSVASSDAGMTLGLSTGGLGEVSGGSAREPAAPASVGRHVRTESDESVAAVSAEARLFEVDSSEDEQTDRGGTGPPGSSTGSKSAGFPASGASVGSPPLTDVFPRRQSVSSSSVRSETVSVVLDQNLGGESVSSSDVVWGRDAMMEQLHLCDAATDVALASSAEIVDLAVGVARGDAPLSTWRAVMDGKQGSPVPVRARDGKFTSALTGDVVEHMAVSDGDVVYDRMCNPPPDGIYVTSDVMRIYTGAAIRAAIQSVLMEPFSCAVTNMDGVAGSGKTHTITHEAQLGDVVLCETTGALKDTAKRLRTSGKQWDDAQWTVDSFLLHVPRRKCNTLWVDESLRLHAAKIFAVVKILKPVAVFCFGDSKQIPILPFVPGFEFSFSTFPFTSVVVKKDTWRSPADVCFITSHTRFYGFHVRTHNPVLRSIKGPTLFQAGMFHAKPDDVVLLTYTQVCKEDLVAAGVKNVMTVGESQGGTFDKVMLYRDSTLGKPLYSDNSQALVAITRHKVQFEYVTVAVNDNSVVAEAISYLRNKANGLLLASHSYAAQGSPVVVRPDAGRAFGGGFASGVVTVPTVGGSRLRDWADDSDSLDEGPT